MKKNALLILLFFSTAVTFGQISKGDILISFDGSYAKTNTGTGVSRNESRTFGQYLTVGSEIGYFFTDHLCAGIGLDYNWGKETRYNTLFFNDYLQEEEMKIKSKVFLPGVSLGVYYPVFDKLYFNTDLKFSYGVIKSNYKTTIVGADRIDFIGSFISGYEIESESEYFSTQIHPELSYFFSPKFSLFLGLGGIEYSVLEWKNENSSWNVSFNPNNWEAGIKIKL